MTLETGYILNNRYRNVKILSQSVSESLYRGWDLNLNHACILKETLETSQAGLQRLEAEAKQLCHIEHPSLLRITDYFCDPERGFYLVMDFFDGQNLLSIQKESGGSIPKDKLLPWMLQVCDTLSFLHTQNPPIFDVDIQPATIFITADNSVIFAGLGGKQELIAQSSDQVIQQFAETVYAPYEQLHDGIRNNFTDIYALGATLYTLLGGEEPPDSILRYNGAQLPSLRSLNDSISPELSDIVSRCMTMTPEERYQGAEVVRQKLEAVMQSPPEIAAPRTTVPSPDRFTPAPTQPAREPPAPEIRIYEPVPSKQNKKKGKSCFLWGGIVAAGLLVMGIITAAVIWLAAPSILPLLGIDEGKVKDVKETEQVSTPLPTEIPATPTLELHFKIFPAYVGTPAASSGFVSLNDSCSHANDPVLSPIKYTYSCTIPAGKPILVNIGWCTSTPEVLEQNWPLMTFALQIDNIMIDLDQDTAFLSDTTSQGSCYSYRAYVEELESGNHVILSSFSISKPLSDGYDDYQTGTYTMEHLVTIP